MIAPRTLMLVANPWAAIDAEGRPCGACRRDPVEDNPALGFIGATLQAELIRPQTVRKVGRKEQVVERAKHDLTFEFTSTPVCVPNTAYYRDRAAKLPYELFPGDKRTADYLGYKDFVSADKLIEAAKKVAVATFDAESGEGTWQELEDGRKPQVVEVKQSTPANSGK
jgi:hypothetical protein